MKTAVIAARTLLGLMFFVFGLNGFLLFIPVPPILGPAGAFTGAMFQTHLTMMIAGIPLALVAAILWVIVALPLRARTSRRCSCAALGML